MSVNIVEDTHNFLAMLEKKINIDRNSYSNKVLICGMGGSGIGGRIMETLANCVSFGEIFAWNNYGIPEWMTSNDNVILIIKLLYLLYFLNLLNNQIDIRYSII